MYVLFQLLLPCAMMCERLYAGAGATKDLGRLAVGQPDADTAAYASAATISVD